MFDVGLGSEENTSNLLHALRRKISCSEAVNEQKQLEEIFPEFFLPLQWPTGKGLITPFAQPTWMWTGRFLPCAPIQRHAFRGWAKYSNCLYPKGPLAQARDESQACPSFCRVAIGQGCIAEETPLETAPEGTVEDPYLAPPPAEGLTPAGITIIKMDNTKMEASLTASSCPFSSITVFFHALHTQIHAPKLL